MNIEGAATGADFEAPFRIFRFWLRIEFCLKMTMYNFQRAGFGRIIESGEHADRRTFEICCYRRLHGQRAVNLIGYLDISQWNWHMKLLCIDSWDKCGMYEGL